MPQSTLKSGCRVLEPESKAAMLILVASYVPRTGSTCLWRHPHPSDQITYSGNSCILFIHNSITNLPTVCLATSNLTPLLYTGNLKEFPLVLFSIPLPSSSSDHVKKTTSGRLLKLLRILYVYMVLPNECHSACLAYLFQNRNDSAVPN